MLGGSLYSSQPFTCMFWLYWYNSAIILQCIFLSFFFFFVIMPPSVSRPQKERKRVFVSKKKNLPYFFLTILLFSTISAHFGSLKGKLQACHAIKILYCFRPDDTLKQNEIRGILILCRESVQRQRQRDGNIESNFPLCLFDTEAVSERRSNQNG